MLSCLKPPERNTFRIFVVFHALYTVQIRDKYENVLKEMSWNDAYLVLGLEDHFDDDR